MCTLKLFGFLLFFSFFRLYGSLKTVKGKNNTLQKISNSSYCNLCALLLINLCAMSLIN